MSTNESTEMTGRAEPYRYGVGRVFRLSGIYAVGSILDRVIAFLLIPLYTSYLGITEYGVVGLMMVLVGLATNLVGPPIASGFVRYYFAPEYRRLQGVLLFGCLLLIASGGVILGCVVLLSRHLLAGVLLQDSDLATLVDVYAMFVFVSPLASFSMTFLQQTERARYFVLVALLRVLVSTAVTVFALVHWQAGVYALALGMVSGAIFDFAAVLPVLVQHMEPRFSLQVLAPPLAYGYCGILNGFSQLLIQSADRYILRFFSTLSTVGVYSFGYGIAGVMQMLVSIPLKRALSPIVLKQEESPDELRSFLASTCTYFYLAAMWLWLGLALFSREAVEILARRQEFWDSWRIVPVVGFAYLQHALGCFFGWGIVMAKKPLRISANVCIAAATNIILNFILIPDYGVMGAAVATMISLVIWNVLKLYYSAKYYGLHFELLKLSYITAVGGGLYACCHVATHDMTIVPRLAWKLPTMVLYWVVLVGPAILKKRVSTAP